MIQPLTREEMAVRVARDIPEGSYVNLGIGVPTLVANYLPAEREVIYHSENGVLGMGPAPKPGEEDPDLINAGKQLVTLLPGGCYFHHTDAFVMMRGGHLDLTVLGAFQVSETGDLANWMTSDQYLPPAVGGAMDLAIGAKSVFVVMEHTTRRGEPKILKTCTYPLTGTAVVDRIYTDLAVIDVTDEGLVVREMIGGFDLEDLQEQTDAPLRSADDLSLLVHRPEVDLSSGL